MEEARPKSQLAHRRREIFGVLELSERVLGDPHAMVGAARQDKRRAQNGERSQQQRNAVRAQASDAAGQAAFGRSLHNGYSGSAL